MSSYNLTEVLRKPFSIEWYSPHDSRAVLDALYSLREHKHFVRTNEPIEADGSLLFHLDKLNTRRRKYGRFRQYLSEDGEAYSVLCSLVPEGDGTRIHLKLYSPVWVQLFTVFGLSVFSIIIPLAIDSKFNFPLIPQILFGVSFFLLSSYWWRRAIFRGLQDDAPFVAEEIQELLDVVDSSDSAQPQSTMGRE